MDIFETIMQRRSVRKYKTDNIKDEDLNKILEAARAAPSWANTQCWRFVIVKDKDIKSQLTKTLSPNNPATQAFIQAPVVIVACAELKVSGFYKGISTTDKGDWYMFDVALAMANLTLAAHALGLGTVHVGLFDAKSVAKIINMPEGMEPVEMTPLGYPAGETKAPPRKPLSEIVFKDRYKVTNSMPIKTRENNNHFIIEIDRDLSQYHSVELEKEILPLLEDIDKPVVLDMTKCNFMDSMGVTTILRIIAKVDKLKLFGLSSKVTSVFNALSLHSHFLIYKTEQEAVAE